MVALLIAQDLDANANAVVRACQEREVEVVRFDLSDYPGKVRLTVDDFTRTRTLHVRGRVVDLDRVRAVLYQRPTSITRPPDGDWDPAAAYEAVAGVLFGLDCLWINRPDRDVAAGHKPYQLELARKVGLRTPRTLLTNVPEVVREVAAAEVPLVYKLLHAALRQPDGAPATVMTTPVDEGLLERLDHVRHAPCQFQERLAKAWEVRLTVIGRMAFPVTIDSQANPITLIDSRADPSGVTYGEFRPVPDEVLASVQLMMRELDLVYGAFDFIVDADGRWTFLEVNPTGQWLGHEERFGIPMTAAFAELLGHGRAALEGPMQVVGY